MATLFDSIWASHCVVVRADGFTLLHIDRHLVHDGSSNAFRMLKERGSRSRGRIAPSRRRTITCRRSAASSPPIIEPHRRSMVEELDAHAEGGRRHDVRPERPRGRASCTSSGPEQGLSQPGMIIVCGDSHTSTHGALGALAFGIGASEVAHVLATQTLWQTKPKSMRITVDGALGVGRSRQGRDPGDHRAGSASPAPPATSSNMPARPSARCRSKAG